MTDQQTPETDILDDVYGTSGTVNNSPETEQSAGKFPNPDDALPEDSDDDDDGIELPEGGKETEVKTATDTPPPKKTVEELETELAALRKELDNEKSLSAKRVKDAQDRMHQATSELAALKKGKTEAGPGTDDEWFNDSDGEEKATPENTNVPEEAVRKPEEQSTAAAAFVEQEARFMAEHTDYNDLVTEELIQAISSGSGELSKKWFSSDKSPEKLYELGQQFRDAQEAIRDPEGFRKRILAETQKTNPKTDRLDEAERLNGGVSKPPPKKTIQPDSDPLDGIY